MRLAHIDSGLGNQMLDYAEYLAIRRNNHDTPLYLEDFLYDLPDDRPGMFSKWNGYELDKVFGIQAPRMSQLLSPPVRDFALPDIRFTTSTKDMLRQTPSASTPMVPTLDAC